MGELDSGSDVSSSLYSVYDYFNAEEFIVGLVTLADNKDVVDPCGEGMPIGVLNVDDVKRSWMSLPGHDGSHSTSVSTSSHHTQVAGVELDSVLDFTRSDIHLNRIVDLDDRVRVAPC